MNTKHLPQRILILVVALILAGCGGEPVPTTVPPTLEDATQTAAPVITADQTATLPLPDTQPTLEPTVDSPFPTLAVAVYPTVVETPFPTPDPAIPPAPTEEVAPPPGGFDRIVLIRTGGPTRDDGTTADEVITINRADASVQRGEARGTLSDSAAASIAELVDAAAFFTVDGVFLGAVPAEPPLPFLYNITVFSGEFERSISAQEGFMPTEIQSLIGAVLSEGLKVSAP